MPEITFVKSEVTEADVDTSRVTDLLIQNGVLFGTTRYDGRITSWDTDTLEIVDSIDYLTGPLPGSKPALALSNGTLYSGGWSGNSLALHDLSGGNLTSSAGVAGTVSLNDLEIHQESGLSHVYGTSVAGNGIVRYTLTSGGALVDAADYASNLALDGLALGTVNAINYLFSASASANTVDVWQIAPGGSISLISQMSPGNGFWASAPTAIETATVNGETYLIVAGNGSSSLSTLHVSPGGGLQVQDHILDDRNTRFADVSALTVVEHLGQVFVIAGGSDDGITILQLLPGGRLQVRASLADTVSATLENPSSIAAETDATGIDIFVASSTEAGLTKLRFETGANMMTVVGTNASDTLIGGNQDDVLIDGEGADTLTGGGGKDLFIFVADGEADAITDFTLDQDVVDLSSYPGLRGPEQLFLTSTASGLRVVYGDEVLDISTSDGSSISTGDFIADGLVIGTRLPQVPVPGLSGPVTIPPTLPERDIYNPPTQQIEAEDQGIERLGVAEADILTGTDFNDQLWGQGGNDTISGMNGDDMLFGGSGEDDLFGGAGNDYLSGGTGRDGGWILGQAPSGNADRLYGGAGNDILLGLAGADTLDGGDGDDILIGGAGRDTFIFRSGTDRIVDFAAGVDKLLLDDALFQGSLTGQTSLEGYAVSNPTGLTLDFGAHELILEGNLGVADLIGHVEIA